MGTYKLMILFRAADGYFGSKVVVCAALKLMLFLLGHPVPVPAMLFVSFFTFTWEVVIAIPVEIHAVST